ncbi:MAG: response regulator [Acidimicrobiia bacterium]|nr:response regulator [Acidimicrobiia bacterium]
MTVAIPTRAKILLVDDRPENLVALEAALRPLEQELVAARSGEEALRCLLTDDFAVILLDVQMPGMDGFETAAQIKERKRSRHIPIIFLTAISRELHQQLRGYEVGAVDYIAKPFDPWVLRTKVAVFVDLYDKTTRVEKQAAELARSNHELEQFSEIVSHDLRNPLVSVVGYLQMVVDGATEAGGETRELVERALRAAESMGTLIDDLLSYALAGKAVGTLRATDAGQAVERAISNLHADIDGAGATINAGALPIVRADSSQLTRLFQNLIGNSVKYRCADRPLKVDIGAERHADQWLFSVTDNGAGVVPGEADSVFTMFYRGSSAMGRPGTGIGLAICKKVVEGHGGRIWVEPHHDGGTVVRFTLPRADGDRGAQN